MDAGQTGDRLRTRLATLVRERVGRPLRRRLTSTDRLVHLMIVIVVPVLLSGLTWISNSISVLPFLIYPPLAAGTYTLFADPESRYSDPERFVGGMTLGAFAGWGSLALLTEFWYTVPPGRMEVHAGATALAVATTALLTWALDLEVPTAFSTALLALLAGTDVSYVVAIALSSAVVAGVFVVWRDRIYERRSEFLYHSSVTDDRVLIPIRGIDADEEVGHFGALLAAAHEAGTVVLFRVTERGDLPPPTLGSGPEGDERPVAEDEGEAWTETPGIGALERVRGAIEETVEVPTQVVLDEGDPEDPTDAIEAAHALDCDLIVTSHEGPLAEPTEYLSGLFRSDLDVIAFHPSDRTTSWSRVLVLVRENGRTARAMLDFATRIAPTPARVSVAHTVEGAERRREAETMLAELVEAFDADLETRVATGSVGAFLERNASYYDVVFVGTSSDRSVASRLFSPPTFRNLDPIDADVALVHLG